MKKARVLKIINHITNFILSRFFCFAGLSFALIAHSCNPPAGHNQPHHTLPRNIDRTNIDTNTIKLPFIICSDAALMIIYGEKYHIVIGKSRKDISNIVLLTLCLIIHLLIFFKYAAPFYISC